MKTPRPSAVLPVAKATAATVILGMCVAVLPLVPVLIVPFLSLPLAYVVARWGVRHGAFVAVVTGALVYVGAGAGAAVLVFLIAAALGAAIGWALRAGWRFGRSLATTAGATVSAFVLWGLFVWLALGVTLTRVDEVANRWIDDFVAQGGGPGMGAESVEAAADLFRSFVSIAPYLAPGLVCLGAILLAACSLGLAYLIFPRVRNKITVAFAFEGFRMHWGAAYASIAGLAMLLFARGDGRWSDIVLYAGVNVLLVSQTLFFIQGLAVVRWITVHRKMRPGAQTALYVAAVLGQLFFQLTGLFGLFDTWVDYRKRFAVKRPGTGPER